MTDAVYVKKFQVQAVDVGPNGLIQPVIFLDYLLDSAAEQAGAYGLGVADLFKLNRTWVLSRFHIELERLPAWGEQIEIRTWPSAKLPLYAVRDFEASDGRGTAARATSSWLIIDRETRRPVKTAEHMSGFPVLDRRAVADDFASLPGLSREDFRREFPVFFSDLDINRHFTATAYIHRAMETVPREILFSHRPASIEVNYRAEAFYGDTIVSRLEKLPGDAGRPGFLHRLSRGGDDRELTLLRTVWAEAPEA